MATFPLKNTFVVSPARCGSTWLLNHIERQGFNNLQEYFNFDGNTLESKVLAADDKSPWVAKLFTDEIYKYNLNVNDLTQQTILLYRSNIFEHFISFVVAMNTGQYNRNINDDIITRRISVTDDDYEYYKHIHNCFETVVKQRKWDYTFKYESMFDLLSDNDNDIVKVSSIEDKLSMLENEIDIDRLKEIISSDSIYNFKFGCTED